VATIDTPTNYTSDDTTLRPVAADRAGPRSTRTRIWRVDDEELVLLEIEDSDAAGFSNVLARGRPTAITVAGRPGWLTHDDENVLVDWQTDSDGPWATLTIPAGLTARLDQLLGALQLAPTTGTANTEGSATANPAVTSPSPTPPTNLMTRQLNGRLTMDGGRAPGISVEVPGMVTAQPVDGGPPTVTETDANGRFEMTLRPGTYRLTATSPSYDAGRTPCTSPGVDVVEITDDADTTVDISCPMR
jgi:hypothetical protein